MHAQWSWLSCNAPAIQAVASFVTVVLTVITIGVLFAAWKAARAQANAADKLTVSTDKQIGILKEQVIATRRQIEESVRPMLDVPVGFIGGPSLLTGKADRVDRQTNRDSQGTGHCNAKTDRGERSPDAGCTRRLYRRAVAPNWKSGEPWERSSSGYHIRLRQ